MVGIVRDAAGQPAANARVDVRLPAHPELPVAIARALDGGGFERRSARCGADGRFRIELPRRVACEVTATDAARDDLAATRFPVVAGGFVELRLVPRATVGGVVRGPGGEPLAGEPVALRPHATSWSRLQSWALPEPATTTVATATDAAGRFALPLPNEYARAPRWEPFLVVDVERAGLGLRNPPLLKPTAYCRALELQLVELPRVRGVVRDAAGRPAAGARAFETLAPHRAAVTGPDGAFELVMGQPRDLAVWLPGHGLATPLAAAKATAKVDGLDVRLGRGLAVRARLLAGGGDVLRDTAVLWVQPLPSGPPLVTAGATDGDGVVRFDGAAADQGLLGFVLVGDTYRVFVRQVPAADVDLGDVTVRTRAVSGTVLSAAGDPLPAVRVVALPPGTVPHEPACVVYTDGAGRFRFDALPLADVQLAVDASVHGLASHAVGVREDEVEIRLREEGVVQAQVTDPVGEPVGGAWITLVRSGGEGEQLPPGPSATTTSVSGRCDARGRIAFRGLPPGDWQVLANAVRDGVLLGGGSSVRTGGTTTVAMRRLDG